MLLPPCQQSRYLLILRSRAPDVCVCVWVFRCRQQRRCLQATRPATATMQCFGGCFAAQNGTRNDNAFPSPHTKKQAACSAGPAWANDDEQNKKCLQPSQDRTAAQGNKARTSLKAKLRRLSNSSSFIGQSEDSTSSSTSSSYEAVVVEDPQQLRQTLQQHGRHIMAVSTLQQEGLQHFVMPGALRRRRRCWCWQTGTVGYDRREGVGAKVTQQQLQQTKSAACPADCNSQPNQHHCVAFLLLVQVLGTLRMASCTMDLSSSTR